MPTVETPSQEDYTTLSNEAWQHIPAIGEELTRLRNHINNLHRRYSDDPAQVKDVDPMRELAKIQEAIRRAIPDISSASASPTDFAVADLLAVYWDSVAKRKNTAPTGFESLNSALSGGLEAGRLVCVLGAPNCGKTTFVNQLADHVANSGRPVLYVTSEDTPGALVAKTLARIGSVNYTAVLKGYDTEKERINSALQRQAQRTSSRTLRYVDAINGITLDEMRDKARAHFEQYKDAGNGVLVVDYLQRLARAIKTRLRLSQDLREVVTMVSENLRAIAVDLDCTVIAITAQNRANYSRGSEGSLASAKESGDIEYTADVMLALTEDKDTKRSAPIGQTAINLNIDKNRQGQRGKPVQLNFWPDRQHFTEVSND